MSYITSVTENQGGGCDVSCANAETEVQKDQNFTAGRAAACVRVLFFWTKSHKTQGQSTRNRCSGAGGVQGPVVICILTFSSWPWSPQTTVSTWGGSGREVNSRLSKLLHRLLFLVMSVTSFCREGILSLCSEKLS